MIDYVPPEVLIERNNLYNNNTNRTKEGKLGMALVGAISSDPRNVRFNFELRNKFFNKKIIFLTKISKFSAQYLELFKNSGVPPKRKLTKFMITQNAIVQVINHSLIIQVTKIY